MSSPGPRRTRISRRATLALRRISRSRPSQRAAATHCCMLVWRMGLSRHHLSFDWRLHFDARWKLRNSQQLDFDRHSGRFQRLATGRQRLQYDHRHRQRYELVHRRPGQFTHLSVRHGPCILYEHLYIERDDATCGCARLGHAGYDPPNRVKRRRHLRPVQPDGRTWRYGHLGLLHRQHHQRTGAWEMRNFTTPPTTASPTGSSAASRTTARTTRRREHPLSGRASRATTAATTPSTTSPWRGQAIRSATLRTSRTPT